VGGWVCHDAGGFHRVRRRRGRWRGDAAADPATAGRGGTERDGEDATDGADKNSIDGDGEDATDGGFAAYDVEPTGEDVGLGVVSVSQGLRVAEDADETTR